MSRAWIFGARNTEHVDRETQLIRWASREQELRAQRLRIFGLEAEEGRHIRISL